ncbi:MAG: protein-methionine-sulfoxide reductase catalytic subunit MsrP [bacterium]
MANIKIRKSWQHLESTATPEKVFLNRRSFIKELGFSGLGAFGLLMGCFKGTSEARVETYPGDFKGTIPKPLPPYPAERNARYTVDRPLSAEATAAAYNNFYEFTTDKARVWKLAQELEIEPWKVEVTGLVHNKRTFDLDDLVKKFPLQERVYRFRCVEAWSMVVPWTGFPFKKLIDEVQPFASAKYVRMVSFNRPEQAVGQRTQSWYPWPYYEGLTMAEAANELTLLATGIYGHALPKQHGAPIRLIVPWKYGYKSIKSIVRIEFVEKQPRTFWNDLTPNEYGFTSNVNPNVPHPRWSQASERVIDTDERIPTLLYNGYEDEVARLY